MALVVSRYKNPNGFKFQDSKSTHWSLQTVRSSSDLENFNTSIGDEDTLSYIRSLNSDTKIVDWYRVLGIRELGFDATTSQIKKAYRKALFLYHPDKCVNKEVVLEESQFVYVTKAYEILSDLDKRHSFDSVDPEFDDRIPSNDINSNDFYHIFGPVFERNARWSRIPSVPMLGDAYTPIEMVKEFYHFWNGFVSNRDFSMHDEEKVDPSACREERREVERINKKARQQMTRDEFERIKTLIDNCENCDPRMILYKKNLKEQKLHKQKQRDLAIQQQKERRLAWQRSNIQSKDQNIQKNTQKTQSVDSENGKIDKTEKKRLSQQLNQTKSKLRKIVEDWNFFVPKDDSLEYRQYRLNEMGYFDQLLRFLNIDTAQNMLDSLSNFENLKDGFTIYSKILNEMFLEKNINLDRSYTSKYISDLEIAPKIKENANIESDQQKMDANSSESVETSKKSDTDNKLTNWNDNVNQIFFKASKLFQTGTANRYEKITDYINQHCQTNFNTKQIISKVKSISAKKPNDPSKCNENKVETKIKNNSSVDNSLNVNDVKKADIDVNVEQKKIPWTSNENRIFQEALKAVKPNDPNRWKLISKRLPGRSEDECKERMKFFLNLINKKKQSTNKK